MRRGVAVVLAWVLMCGGSALARQGGDPDNAHSRAGGKAAEHMSERGMENANAQWADGAAKADERSGLRHQDGHGGTGSSETDRRRGHGKDKHESHKYGKDKADKEHREKKDHRPHKADKPHKGNKDAGKGY